MKKQKTSFLICLMCLCVLFSINLSAQETTTTRVHEGFFMRFLVGGGPGSIAFDMQGNEMEFKATSALFHFQIGKEISNNLALFADLGGLGMSNPEVSWKGSTITMNEASLSTVGFGAGVSYYFMPADVYISGSVMLARATFEYSNSSGSSEMGPGIFICAGKEWWVGKKWGLGASLFFEAAMLKDKKDSKGNQAEISSRIFGIAFSATMF